MWRCRCHHLSLEAGEWRISVLLQALEQGDRADGGSGGPVIDGEICAMLRQSRGRCGVDEGVLASSNRRGERDREKQSGSEPSRHSR